MASEAASSTDEVFVLRVKDHALADRLRRILSQKMSLQGSIELVFREGERRGELRVEGIDYPVWVLNLPTVVEAYKTYDDIHLVKVTDVGQVLLVGPPHTDIPQIEESPDGVTPPMRNARQRHFKPVPKVDPAVVSQVERDLLALLNGKAPMNTTITDVEEEYVIDSSTNEGAWQPVQK